MEKPTEFLHKQTMIDPKQGEVIYRELQKLPDEGNCLDIGTGLGHSSTLFSRIKPKWMIYTVEMFGYGSSSTEPHVYRNEKAELNGQGILEIKRFWKASANNNIIQIVEDSRILPWNLELIFLFIDADHSYEFVKSDFDRFSKFVRKDGVIIFHDSHLPGVEQKLLEIKETGKFDVEITNTLGVVKWKK